MKENSELSSREGRKYFIILALGFLVLLIWAAVDYALLPDVPRLLILVFFLALILLGVGAYGLYRTYPPGEGADYTPWFSAFRV